MGAVSSPKPSRSSLTVRDMAGAVGLLVLIVLLVAGVGRSCTFAPTGPTVDPASGPVVDAAGQLRALAGSTPFPLRVPAVPADWRANAVDTERVGGERAVRTGYLTPAGRYLRVVQSAASEADLVASEAQGAPVAAGPFPVGGTTWVTYTDDTREPIRVADLGAVRVLVTGSGGDDDVRTLAAAVTGGTVLPTGR
jgi:hypothetical protein